MDKHQEGLLSIHSAVLIFGMTALFSKTIGLSAIDITFIRSIFAVIAIVFYIKLLKERIFIRSKKDLFFVFILGSLLTIHWVTYFHSMQVSSIAIGIISLYTYPVMTVFLEPLFHGERPHFKDIVSAIVIFIGILLLVPEFTISNQTTQGVLWGVFSAFLFALRNIIQGRYFKHYSAKHTLMYQGLVVIILLLPFVNQNISHVTQHQWVLLLVLGVFFTALPHTLFANSLRYLKAKTVGLIGCMQVVYGTVFAAVFLSELPTGSTLLGGLIVVSAALFETYSSVKK